jgi:hypothetical protein
MSLETKIRQLLESKKAGAKSINEATEAGMNAPHEPQHHQGSSKKAEYDTMNPSMGMARRNLDKYQEDEKEDDTLKKGPAEAQAKQGDSEVANYKDVDPFNTEVDLNSDGSIKKGIGEPQHHQGDSRHAKYSEMDPFQPHAMSSDNPEAFVREAKEGEDLSAENGEDEKSEKSEKKAKKDKEVKESLRKDIENLFAADTSLSEEFKTQAGSIFEAAVIARVNHEVETIAEELAEQNVRDFEELKEGLVEKIDSYLNYVTEQWMKDNELEVELGLRTEVAEDFMLGLKNLFQEHYFEVPNDKVDVLEDMGAKVDEVTARLDETIQVNVALKEELDGIKRERIIEQACKDLTATDAEKMSKLLEGVEFDNEKLFEEKVLLVKENYFPGNTPNSPEKLLEEDVQVAGAADKKATVPAHMKPYVEALSRTARVKHFN